MQFCDLPKFGDVDFVLVFRGSGGFSPPFLRAILEGGGRLTFWYK